MKEDPQQPLDYSPYEDPYPEDDTYEDDFGGWKVLGWFILAVFLIGSLIEWVRLLQHLSR